MLHLPNSFPEIRSHLLTNNLVVRQQIIRDNISKLMNWQQSSEFVNLSLIQKKEFNNILDQQHQYLKHTNIAISKNSQINLF